MKSYILIVAIMISFYANAIGQNIGDSPQTKVGFTTKIGSKILNDSLNIFTHLPFNYKEGKGFPLILLLDAHTSFKAFSASTELMAYARSIPTSIIVGFPQYKYADYDSSNIDSKMDIIARFFDNELLPYLESKYNITQTIIWGQGTEITTYLMLDKPDLFNGYIADVPDLNLISGRVNSKDAFANLEDKNVDYFIFSSKAEESQIQLFLDNIKANAPKGLNWHYSVSEEPNKIIYFLNNYMHAIELFFLDKERVE
ncbi:alpha/beta hydrolase-fold protein [Labilibacter marinus]|uniref:alpha/beta hydrolase-fold protein n=1 Tax=Labilibacter marinus TaxID=1477105 RepID=UPI00094F7FA1|nr:alpha/beta hydrolase-fold protein [Labilibacter marinus]